MKHGFKLFRFNESQHGVYSTTKHKKNNTDLFGVTANIYLLVKCE